MGEEKRKLPEGWAEATIGDVTLNKVPQTVPDKDSFFTYVDISSIDNTSKEIVSPKELHGEQAPSRARQSISVNDVLVSMTRPNLNAVALVPHSLDGAIASTGFDILRSIEVEPKWLYLHVRSGEFVEDMSALVKGALYPAIKSNDVRSYRIPVPPFNEQKRIVARIEELQTRSRRAREALETVPDLLEQLRESILAAAFRGDLTKEWRKNNPNIEPASELLKRIRVERRKRWEAAELEKLKAKGVSGDKLDEAFAKQRKKYKDPAPVENSDLPKLPEGWCWAGLEELSEWVTDGTHQPPPFTKEGIPFLVISNMVDGEIEWDKVDKWVSPETYDKYTGIYKPNKGDIIYSTVGSYGIAVEVLTEKRFMFQRHIGHIRPLSEMLSITYLTLALNSSLTKSQADKVARGVAQKTVNLSDLRQFCIPLASTFEQNEIVRLSGQMLQKIEAQQKNLISSREYLDIFDQSILSKAFRGQLVPQDPKDEPASVLLERIRKEKEREAATQQPRDKRRGRKMKKKKDEQREVLVVLREASRALTPEEVFAEGGFKEDSVDVFYEQLRKTVISKQVREIREGDLIQLEAIGK